MAQHINSVAGSSIAKVSNATMKALVRNGDFLFCSGREPVSREIQRETASPWSHVGMVWIIPGIPEVLFMESVFKYGVRISRLFPTYIDGYNGDLVLARRPVISENGIKAIQLKFIQELLGDGYDAESEVGFALHKICSLIPVVTPNGKYFCSGVWQYCSTGWSPVLQPNATGLVHSTPEDIYTDPTVEPVCALVKGTN